MESGVHGSFLFDFHFTPRHCRVVSASTENFQVSFPAIRGVQAGREYYIAMCPLEMVVKLIRLDEDNDQIPPDLRAQRILNKGRVPAISRYILENPETYAFSSLTISVDAKVTFIPHAKEGITSKMGVLSVPLDATFLINDGQHRRAAIANALQERPQLKYETISLVIYIDLGLKRSQQLFSDLNRYVVRPTPSLSILYDHRDPLSRLTHNVVENVTVFKGMTETAKSTISNRSRKLFTLSSIYQANCKLLGAAKNGAASEEDERRLIDFWNEVAKHIPDWTLAAQRKAVPSELRRDFIHAHGIALRALSHVGVDLLTQPNAVWKKQLKNLEKVEWSRSNAGVWEGRAMVAGKISKAHNNIILSANVIKKALGLPLNPKEEEIEMLYSRGKL